MVERSAEKGQRKPRDLIARRAQAISHRTDHWRVRNGVVVEGFCSVNSKFFDFISSFF